MKPQSATRSRSKSGKKKASKRGKPTFTEQARRRQILEVSSNLFRSQGFDNTSLDDIAKEAEISRGMIFYYFDGKRELGEEVIRGILRQYSDYVKDRVSKKKTSKAQVLEFVDACLDYQSDHREIYLQSIDLAGCFGDADDKYQLTVAVNQRTRELLAEMIKKGQKDGNIAKVPVYDLADVIQAFVDGLMEMSALDPDAVNIKGCKQMIRRMLLGIIEKK